MRDLANTSLEFSNYKCFGPDVCGFERIMPINLILGRNNSGKSSILDLLRYVTFPRHLNELAHKGGTPHVRISIPVHEDVLKQAFRTDLYGGPIPGNHWQYGKKWLNAKLSLELTPRRENNRSVLDFISIQPEFDLPLPEQKNALAKAVVNPFSDMKFVRLSPDRDIVPEEEKDTNEIAPNGAGSTVQIHNFINKSHLPSSLVEEKILSQLNKIFEPDGTFSRILVQQTGKTWEVYIEEVGKGRISLTHTGSGVKTILLVLCFLYLLPALDKNPIQDYLFGMEELENNLHPALQRRLLLYLRSFAIENGCHFFLTTHSSVAIDLFAQDESAQILHVTHDKMCATVRRAQTYVDNYGILNDLDVRASDLLQSNCIVWVEGPSDRLYFNRWVELYSNGELREGAHYQCVFYGGRLLAHLSAEDPAVGIKELVRVLNVNRNAIVIADSDKRYPSAPKSRTKQRLFVEAENVGGMAWITKGKEIENYIPVSAIRQIFSDKSIQPPGQFEDFANYLDNIKAGEGEKYKRNKVLFAEKVLPLLTQESLGELDVKQQIERACSLIRSWNGQT